MGYKTKMMKKILHTTFRFSGAKDPTNLHKKLPIIQHHGNETLCDFSLLNEPFAKLPSIIVLNNELNQDFFAKCMVLTENVVLADGGANHFYESDFRDSDKVRAVVGDFDCITQDVMNYYN